MYTQHIRSLQHLGGQSGAPSSAVVRPDGRLRGDWKIRGTACPADRPGFGEGGTLGSELSAPAAACSQVCQDENTPVR